MEDFFYVFIRENGRKASYIHGQGVDHGVQMFAGKLHQAKLFLMHVHTVGLGVYGEVFMRPEFGDKDVEIMLFFHKSVGHIKYNNILAPVFGPAS